MMSKTRYVAIVDDDESVRGGLAALLRAHGIETRTYASGPEFLKALRFAVPSCLITDMNMPEMTGLELQEELVRRGLRIATIVITGGDDKSTGDKCRALGVIACLRKPMENEVLLAAIDSCLGAPSAAPSFAAGGR
jgi:FixJ family two-component response regulator